MENEIKFYRYNIINYATMDMDEEYTKPILPNPKIVLTELNLHKETPKGYWIGYGYYQPEYGDKLRGRSIWVSKTSKRRYAYPTKEEALKSFIYRQKRAVEILDFKLKSHQIALQDAEFMYNKNFGESEKNIPDNNR